MDRYAKKGIKKLFSLTRTKLRLADECGTAKTKPAPVPLPKVFRGVELYSVSECKTYWQSLKDEVDDYDDIAAAYATLQLCDIIESVKYGFESQDDMPQITDDGLAEIEAKCRKHADVLNILLMTTETMPNSVYFGDDPPQGSRTYSRVVSGIAPLLRYTFRSQYLSDGKRLRNIKVHCGRRTLLGDAILSSIQAIC